MTPRSTRSKKPEPDTSLQDASIRGHKGPVDPRARSVVRLARSWRRARSCSLRSYTLIFRVRPMVPHTYAPHRVRRLAVGRPYDREDMEPSALTDLLREACRVAFAGEPVVAAYLHGSAASGRTGPFSDVDVALLLEEPCEDPLGESVRLGGLLAEHAQVSDLDVRSINGADLRFQGRVVQDGAVIHGQDSPARVAFEVRTLKRYLDFEYYEGSRREIFLQQGASRATEDRGAG